MMIWSRWKIVLLCTGLNFLFEYAVRGIINILYIPLLSIGIIGIYFVYFTILEDLIIRYRLKDYQLLLWGFFLGIFVMVFTTGQIFNITPSLKQFFIFGINYIDFIFVNFVWWSLFQTVISFYFANRVTLRDWEHSTLGKLGWASILTLFGILLFLFQLSRFLIYNNYGFIISFLQITQYVVFGTLEGYISILIFLFIFGFLSFRELKKSKENEVPISDFKASKFIDVIIIIIIIISIISAFFIDTTLSWRGVSQVNPISLSIMILSAAILGIIIIIYRLISKKLIYV